MNAVQETNEATDFVLVLAMSGLGYPSNIEIPKRKTAELPKTAVLIESSFLLRLTLLSIGPSLGVGGGLCAG